MVTKKKGTCAICGTPIIATSTYCKRHAAYSRWGRTDREQKKMHREQQEKEHVIESFSAEFPSEVVDILKEVSGKSEYKHLQRDLEQVIAFARMAEAPPTVSRSSGGYESVLYGSLYRGKNNKTNPYADYAADFNISHIEDMLKCGQVLFGLALKKAPIASIFRNKRSYAFEFDGVKSAFQTAIKENMYEILPKTITNLLTCFDYGASFNEIVWKVSKNNPLVADINPIYLGSIKNVKYRGSSFNGFTQSGGSGTDVKIPLEQSLVISYNKRFRNVYGESALKAVYPFFFFYDIIWRSFVRYLERTGTPQLLAKAPSNFTVRKSDGTYVEALDEALSVAYRGSRSPAIAIPSDTDPDGNSLYSLEYLKSDLRGDQFINALNLLGTLILRSVILPDTVATTQGTGSYGMADVHYQVTLLDSERVLTEVISQLNSYLLTKFVRYKYGEDSEAKVKLVTEGLNIAEKDALLKLLMQAVNAKHAVANEIDWKTLAAVNNIPIVPEGEEYDDPNFGGTPEVAVVEKPKVKEEESEKSPKEINNSLSRMLVGQKRRGNILMSESELDEILNK